MQHHQIVFGRGDLTAVAAGGGVVLTVGSDLDLASWTALFDELGSETEPAVAGDRIAELLRHAPDVGGTSVAFETTAGLLIAALGGCGVAIHTRTGVELVVMSETSGSVRLAPPGATVVLGVRDDLAEMQVGAQLPPSERSVQVFPAPPDGPPAEQRHDADRTVRKLADRADDPVSGVDERSSRNPTRELLGLRCELGHLNPPSSSSCLRCSESLVDAPLQYGERPSLGTLVLSDGRSFELHRSLVVGRRPTAASHDGRRECEVVTVESPDKLVSRNHFEVSVIEWELRLIDRGSHNGTRLHRRASQDILLQAGQSTPLEIGDQISFAGMSAVIDPPSR